MPPKMMPIHLVQSIQAEVSELTIPGTVIWAKLRGYPWWPGRVKGLSDVPKELATIAKTQYKPGAVVAVYFFGSHDFSLVPIESLRPFEDNLDLFSQRSTAPRFLLALKEARKSDKNVDAVSASKGSIISKMPPEAEAKRKRGRPRKTPLPQPTSSEVVIGRKRLSTKMFKGKPVMKDSRGRASGDYLLYCRIKLQKILLRPDLKDKEIPIAEKILEVLDENKVAIESLEASKVGIVLRIASFRSDFREDGPFPQIGERLHRVLLGWRSHFDELLASSGL